MGSRVIASSKGPWPLWSPCWFRYKFSKTFCGSACRCSHDGHPLDNNAFDKADQRNLCFPSPFDSTSHIETHCGRFGFTTTLSFPPLPSHLCFGDISPPAVIMFSRHTPHQSERDLRIHDSRPPPNHVHPHLNGTSQPPLNTSSIPPQLRIRISPAASANGTTPISSVRKLAQAWLLIGSDID